MKGETMSISEMNLEELRRKAAGGDAEAQGEIKRRERRSRRTSRVSSLNGAVEDTYMAVEGFFWD